jgi:hypothetical protein
MGAAVRGSHAAWAKHGQSAGHRLQLFCGQIVVRFRGVGMRVHTRNSLTDSPFVRHCPSHGEIAPDRRESSSAFRGINREVFRYGIPGGPDEFARNTQSTSRAQRKPMFVVELSGVFDVRAATLYRLQYEAWQRYDPPRIDLVWPPEGPTGFERVAKR